ncbi:hypothetical protein H6G45_09085 [Synechocystis sp. FACHB-383]|uniref:hypothetical protein n=1 Tax=Synechocystis sp. FACHB-383 TaxID=2692864 RepID=UPI0016828E5E|nr:hypothetical protein [Synechocystis sp. FACHB-383]MBD2653641.1 hypothetical protein [Synechocystis sp. FACHB-383]
MEVIRSIDMVQDGQVVLNLPSEWSGQQVEVIVLTKQKPSSKRKIMRGALRQYAKPELIPLESDVWERANFVLGGGQ